MKVQPVLNVPAPRLIHINSKVFDPVFAGVKALGSVLLKTAGHAVLPKPLPSMKDHVPFAQNLFKRSALSRVLDVKTVFSGKANVAVKQQAREAAVLVLRQSLLKALTQEPPITLKAFKAEVAKQVDTLEVEALSKPKVDQYLQKLAAKVFRQQQGGGVLRDLSLAVQAKANSIRSEQQVGPFTHLSLAKYNKDIASHLQSQHPESFEQVKKMYGEDFLVDLVGEVLASLPITDPFDLSQDFTPEAKDLEQQVVKEVKRWHVELFKMTGELALKGPIPGHLKTEKAESLYQQFIDSNVFAKANPEALEQLIRHVVGSMKPMWQMFSTQGHESSRLSQFNGGYLKANREQKGDPGSALPFSLVKTTTGKVYELLNTLTSETSKALRQQHGFVARDKLVLGEGSFGKVRLARDVQTQEIVAVKKFNADGAFFDAEEEIASINEVQNRVALENPSARSTLARVLGHAHAHKSYVFMPLLNRGDGVKATEQLAKMRAQGKHEEANVRFLHIAKGYAEAVKNLHALGFVHRDIKPANFMHSQNANGVEQTSLIDFGFTGDQRDSSMRYVFGTSMYMPPEVQDINGPANKDQYDATQMDSYSLGMVLLELLKGKNLYDAPLSLTLKRNDGQSTAFELKVDRKAFSSYYEERCSAGVPSQLLRNLAPNHIENVIAKLLAADPKKRMTATEAFNVLSHWGHASSRASTSTAPRRRTWADHQGKPLGRRS